MSVSHFLHFGYCVKSNNVKPKQDKGCDDRSAKVLDAVDANIAVLNSEGVIVSTNKGWRQFASNNRRVDGTLPMQTEVGANYLTACSAASGYASENAMLVYEGIRAILDGKKRHFSHEYPCHSPDRQRWFLMKVKSLPQTRPREVVVTHIDITDRHIAESGLLNKQRELNTALLDLQVMAEKIQKSLSGSILPGANDLLLTTSSQPEPGSNLIDSLSKREIDVLSGLVRGERNLTIASRLQLSPKSVSTYRARIFEKLKVDSTAQLLRLVSSTSALEYLCAQRSS